ncbi:MAG: tyrosine-type recombinase/integrase [Azospirillaceae bacterium]
MSTYPFTVSGIRKWTKEQVRTAPPGKMLRLSHPRVPGLSVRAKTPNGNPYFAVEYVAAGGRRKLMTLGRAGDAAEGGEMTIAEAEERAAQIRYSARDGADPAAERRARREAPTVADLAAEFLEKEIGRLRERTSPEYKRYIAQEIVPEFGDRRVVDLTRAEVAAWHKRISERGARRKDGTRSGKGTPVSANRALSILSGLLSYGVRTGAVQDNVARVARLRNKEKDRTAERPIEPEEWTRIRDYLLARVDDPRFAALWTMAATGCRMAHVESMPWSEIDLDKALWRLAGDRAKNGVEQKIGLDPVTVGVLRRQEGRGVGTYVFPPLRVSGRPHMGRRATQDAWEELREALGLDGLRMYSLRSMTITLLYAAGASFAEVHEAAGHRSMEVTQRYIRNLEALHETVAKKRAAALGLGD